MLVFREVNTFFIKSISVYPEILFRKDSGSPSDNGNVRGTNKNMRVERFGDDDG